jgi:thiol-disulfide isomerase/thioredoxin
MRKSYTLLFVLTAVVLFYLWRYKRAPDIEAQSISVMNEAGETHTLQSILSDTSIVVFYASWCGPCLKELRSLKTHYESYRNTGIHFYCITDDSVDKMDVMRSNMPTEITFLHTASLNKAGIYSIPASFYFLNGRIIDKQLSVINWEEKDDILKTFYTH